MKVVRIECRGLSISHSLCCFVVSYIHYLHYLQLNLVFLEFCFLVLVLCFVVVYFVVVFCFVVVYPCSPFSVYLFRIVRLSCCSVLFCVSVILFSICGGLSVLVCSLWWLIRRFLNCRPQPCKIPCHFNLSASDSRIADFMSGRRRLGTALLMSCCVSSYDNCLLCVSREKLW